jgi:hypothetical protein
MLLPRPRFTRFVFHYSSISLHNDTLMLLSLLRVRQRSGADPRLVRLAPFVHAARHATPPHDQQTRAITTR